MKKNGPRKLTLAKETLRMLVDAIAEGPLAEVAGATGTCSAGDPCQTGTRCNISFCICD